MHPSALKTRNGVHWTQKRWVQVVLCLLCMVFLLSHLKKSRAVFSIPREPFPLQTSPCLTSSTPCLCESSPIRELTSALQQPMPWPSNWMVSHQQNETSPCTAEEQATFLDIQKRELIPLEQSCVLWETLPHGEEYETQREIKLMECFQSAMIYVNDMFDAPTQSEYKICNPMDRKKGISLLQKICKEGHDSLACESLISIYFNKENFNQDPEHAMIFLRDMCPTTPQACGVLGSALADATKPWYKPSEAEYYLQKACDQEGGESCLAVLRLLEEKGNSPQGTERILWVAKACSSETEETKQACEEISRLILDGHGSWQKIPVETKVSVPLVTDPPEPPPTGWSSTGEKIPSAQPTNSPESSDSEEHHPLESPSHETPTQPMTSNAEEAHA